MTKSIGGSYSLFLLLSLLHPLASPTPPPCRADPRCASYSQADSRFLYHAYLTLRLPNYDCLYEGCLFKAAYLT